MNVIEVMVQADGRVELSIFAPWVAAVLLELEDLLDPDQPDRVVKRLYPTPSRDPVHQEEWKKYVHPDLFALLASARQIVATDLKSIIPPPLGESGWRLNIPAQHVRAWISALNTARLTIAEIEEIGALELEALPDDLEDRLSASVAKIRLFGWIQELILEGLYPDATP